METTTTTKRRESRRPQPLRPSSSFSRLESPQTSPSGALQRTRASTIQAGAGSNILFPQNVVTSPDSVQKAEEADIFAAQDKGALEEQWERPGSFNDLPIEIQSLTERYSTAFALNIISLL